MDKIIICKNRMIINVLNYTLGPVIILGPTILGVCALKVQKFSFYSISGFLVMFALSIFIFYHMYQNFSWVKISGDKISGIKVWSREFLEFNIDDINKINCCRNGHGIEGGYEITFKNSSKKMYVVKWDMINYDLLLRELYLRKKGAFTQPYL